MTVDEYLRELKRHLRVGALAKRRIVREVETHLAEAVAIQGQEQAIASFGRPDEIAAHFAPASRARWLLPIGGLIAAGAVAVATIYGNTTANPRVAAGKVPTPTKSLTITGVVANDKVYDGTTSATVDFSGASLTGIVSADDVSVDTNGVAICSVALTTPVSIVGQAIDGESTRC